MDDAVRSIFGIWEAEFGARPCLEPSRLTKDQVVIKIMKRAFVILALGGPGARAAQPPEIVAPAGSVTWHYECKVGDCAAKCAVNGAELFSTGTFFGLIIMKLPDQGFWIEIDAGKINVDYVQTSPGDKLLCTITGGTSVRMIEPGKAFPSISPRSP
jgi:hypothetical protein